MVFIFPKVYNARFCVLYREVCYMVFIFLKVHHQKLYTVSVNNLSTKN